MAHANNKIFLIYGIRLYWSLNFCLFLATHGSGVGLVNMAAMVTKLELITGEGKILTLSAQNNKDIFNAAQVCY